MIKGLKELDRKLSAIGNMSMHSAVDKGIQFVQGAAKENCPSNNGELRESIFTKVYDSSDNTIGTCYTNKSYGPYVEFGTGPKGQESHVGISPNVDVMYSQSPWWIHESQIDQSVAEKYHWFYIDTPDGRFYQCSGQAAQPFMYPALKNNENAVTSIIKDELQKEIRRNLR